ncbi:MAG: NINE protein [Clostridia bacterium]|nr:NINE protein [Clostridia bacterium]
MICKKCGAEIKSTLKFCNKCGTKVVLDEPKTPDIKPQSTPINNSTPPTVVNEPKAESVAKPEAVEVQSNVSATIIPANTVQVQQPTIQQAVVPTVTEEKPIQTKPPKPEKPIVPLKPKNKTVAGLLAIFLGFFGIHWFYLGKPIRAIIYLAVYIFCPFIWLLYIVEGIYFLCAKQESFDKYRSKW